MEDILKIDGILEDIWEDNSMPLDGTERSESTERSEGVNSWGFWGRCKPPPNGVQGRSPGNFLDFRCPRSLEMAILACIFTAFLNFR